MRSTFLSIFLILCFSIHSCGVISTPAVDSNKEKKSVEKGKENNAGSIAVKADQYGLKGDGVFYWGALTVEPIGENKSRITLTGKGHVFYKAMVGMEFASSRIHKNPNIYPAQGDNYFPGLLTCRYAKVLQVENEKSLIVDFAYNGGNQKTPQASVNVDGYFFTDNRIALKRLIESTERTEEIVLEDDKIYILKGLPNAKLNQSINIKRSGTGKSKPILMMSTEDSFDNAKNGNGSAATYQKNFGGKNVFVLPNNNNHCIINDIDICPTIYTVPTIQYGIGYDYFWYDGDAKSSQKRVCSIRNSNMDAVKDAAIKALGKEREGMTWDLPILAKSMNGGIDDGNEITALTEYSLYNTSWRGRYAMTLKCKDRAGILFKVIGNDANNPVQLIENTKVKATSFSNIPIRFKTDNGHTIAEINSDAFNWYLMANQDWNGGTSTNYNTFNRIEVELNGKKRVLFFHNNADFRELHGKGGETVAFIDAKEARLFDVFPVKGEVIKPWKAGVNTGVFRKVDDQTFDVWGYQLAVGDVLSYKGKQYTIEKRQYRTKDKKQSAYYVHYWRLTLKGPPIKEAAPSFTVVKSSNQQLLDGAFRNCRVFVNRDEFGHLFYTDGGVNMHFENVETHGYWRSSSGGIGKPDKMYKAATVAYFKNVVTHGRGGIGLEWAPPYLAYREKTQGEKYRLVYEGGNTFINQTKKDAFTVECRNKPVLRGKFISPVNGDDKGFTPDPNGGAIAITLHDGDSFSLKNVKGQSVNLYAYGKCTLNIDGYEGELTEVKKAGQKPRMHGIRIQKADATTQLTITGKGGKAPITCNTKAIKNSNQLKINLTNWNEIGDHFSNKFIKLPFQEDKDLNFSKNIKVSNAQGENLVKLPQKKQ